MANTIKPKRSNTASKVPNTSELVSGELGVNMADKKIYINNGTSVVQVGAGLLSALGDVTITSPTNGQGLSYNGTAWVNATGAGSGTVTSVSVVSANGLAGTVATATSTPAITLSTTITGLLKGNATAISAAVSGTDYAPATSGSSILYGNGAGGFSAVTVGTGLSFTTGTLSATNAGTVTSVTATSPVASTGGATPVISMPAATTTVSGYLTSADWNTFNGKQAALGFTPYNATNPSNYIALASAITGYTVGTNTALAATDTLLAGLGKIQGQINARGAGTVTGVTGTAPVVSSGGATPAISMAAASSGVNGYMTGTYATKLDGIAAGATNVTNTNQLTNGAGFITSAGTSAACSGNAATATLATKASTLSQSGGNGTAMTFNWSGQSGQPTWLWGSNDGSNIYVWNPSNFSVNYANTAGSAPANGGTSAACSGNSATATALSTASGSAPSYSSRAFASFTGGGSINASKNITSITHVGTGRNQPNFTTAMATATYAVTTGCSGTSGDGFACIAQVTRYGGSTQAQTASNFIVYTGTTGQNNSYRDVQVIFVSCFE
jgi:hypothetical protein